MFVPSATVIHSTRFPLLALERRASRLDPALIEAARRELRRSSGYLLGVQDGAATHPACVELARALRPGPEFTLSFYKLFEGESPFGEGPHLDTHPRLTESTELLRVLVNLSEHPRRFLYATSDRWQLAAAGVRCGRRVFEPLVLPPGAETRVVALPGRTATTVHALRFLASAIPHVGIDEPCGHFLVSFETLAGAPAL